MTKTKAKARATIEEIKVYAIYDEYADTSYLGEYTDDMEPGIIVRLEGEFYEKLPAPMERDVDGRFIGKGAPEVPQRGREYRGFRPYAGGENPGTKTYYKYGMQDFERMEALQRGDWHFIGIRAQATVKYQTGNGCYRLETLTSGGLWGIESDSGDYLQEIMKEELMDLKDHLEIFNVNVSDWEEQTRNLELEDK